MTTHEILHIIRNPSGHSEEQIREARNAAADRIENLESHLRICIGWTNRAIALEVSGTMREQAERQSDEAQALLEA